MGVVVAIIGLNVGVINEAAYTILLLAAVVTSLIAPAMLKWAVARWEPHDEEADRLERESLRDEAEILGATRILLPTRGGLNTVYAARLVAAVFPRAEVTVLTIEIPSPRGPRRYLRRRTGSAADPSPVLEALGETSSRTVSTVATDPAAAIIAESRLGYDLLVVGGSQGADGLAVGSTPVERVLRETRIATAIVQIPRDADAPSGLPERVVVPITATRSSRAAEEFGYTVALAAGGGVTAVHVIDRPDGEGVFMPGSSMEAWIAADDMIGEARVFGERLGVAVDGKVRVAPNTEQEILDLATSDGADLLVLGASNRPVTNRPFYGHRISYLIEHAPLPLVVIALPSFQPGM
jgi:nucleotide-binding universal stress UspA family protein